MQLWWKNIVFPFSDPVWYFLESLTEKKKHRSLVSRHSPLCFAFTAREVSERKRNTFPFALGEGKQDLRPEYLGLPLPLSHRVRELCFEKSWTLKEGRGALWHGSEGCKKMEKDHSTLRRRKGVTSLHAAEGHLSADGEACGCWMGLLNSKRCVLGKGSWGTARKDGVFGFKMDLRFLDTEHHSDN